MKLDEFKTLIKGLKKDATTTGISLSTGLNFYYLEPTARAIYPVKYPLLASVPRVSGQFAGMVVGGDGVHWKAITGISSQYPATSEGNRNAVMRFTEKDYFSAFKNIGEEGQVTFQAERAGLGFEDNLGLAQVSLLNQMLNDEEKMMLFGNSGSSGNGFQLGTCPTPTNVAVASGTLPDDSYYVRCIALTGWGVSLAAITGVQIPFVRTNADGSQDTINGGTSAISATSLVQATTSQNIKSTVVPVAGAMGYAWYLSPATTALADFVFVAVSSAPNYTFTALPSGGNQHGDATGLTVDNSANALDFDGLSTWFTNYAPASSGLAVAGESYWKDLNGAPLTSNGDGTIAEFEAVLDFLWLVYKISPDKIWVGGTLIGGVRKAILSGGTSNAVTRMNFQQDAQGRITGGAFAVAYMRKYGPSAGKSIDVETHPWLPEGVIMFDLIQNPYPAAGDSIPSVRRMACLEDHFSIYWPFRNLTHEVGVYCFPTMQHYIPFGGAMLTGVGPS